MPRSAPRDDRERPPRASRDNADQSLAYGSHLLQLSTSQLCTIRLPTSRQPTSQGGDDVLIGLVLQHRPLGGTAMLRLFLQIAL